MNNAGKIFIKPLEENSLEAFDDIMNIDVKAPMLLIKEILPFMRKQKLWHIINIISTSGLKGRNNETIHCASKFAIRGLTESIRCEVKNDGIRVASFYPGGMKTNLFDKFGKDTSDYMEPNDVA